MPRVRYLPAANYDELIDHPVEMGEFTLATFKACGVAARRRHHRTARRRLSTGCAAI